MATANAATVRFIGVSDRRYLSHDSVRDATVPVVCIDKLWIRCRRHLPLN